MEIGMYALAIKTDEVVDDIISNNGENMEQLFAAAKRKPCAFQGAIDDNSILLFFTPEDRQKAYDKAVELGFKTVTAIKETAFVDTVYLEGYKP